MSESFRSSPQRILLVIHRLRASGGAERQLAHLATGLATKGHKVVICCVDRSFSDLAPLRSSGVEVVELHASGRIARALAVPRIARLARRADVVHCTLWDATLWGRLGAILARRPVLAADHATDRTVAVSAGGAPRGRWVALHNRVLDRATYATVSVATTQRALLVEEGVSAEKIVHIPNGVPVDELVRRAGSGPTRAELGIPEDAPLLMHVGVFRAEKNQAGSLRIAQRLRERLPELRVVFVGDGPLQEQVEEQARAMGADWAQFLGVRDDVPELLGLADLMILPSLSDAMPMTVLEALAIGVPVVATDVGDVAGVLSRGGGVVVEPGDDGAFADACLALLEDGPRRAEAIEAGRAVARGFDADAMVDRYAELFAAAANGRAR